MENCHLERSKFCNGDDGNILKRYYGNVSMLDYREE